MTELINDPLYSIALFPNDSFIDDLNRFKKKNDLDMSDIKTNFNIHYIIKAPFYLSHLNDENEIIKKFNKSNFKLLKNILNKSFEFESIEKINNFHSAKFKGDEEFNFFSSLIMREFDIYRRTLDNLEIKIDLLKFNNLTEKQFIYYQIWGYPYYFEFSSNNIPLVDSSVVLKDQFIFKPLQYKSIKLLKKEKLNSFKFIELSSQS